jgi:activator of 2-hydroxyglutaryl-CoA dehydratase
VFSATEVLENIRRGKQVEDIVKGLFFSVISRITEMDAFTEKVVMTGGVVAHNPYLVEMTGQLINRPILVPDLPQFTGALGAAYMQKRHLGIEELGNSGSGELKSILIRRFPNPKIP